MLNKIIGFSIQNKLIIGLFMVALIGLGVYQTTQLPIDAVPDITDNQVQIITIAPSFGATDIERLVTFPIEQANSNISGIKEIRSFSRFGLSLVTIVFNDATDIYWARQQVAERLQKVQTEIPQGIGTPELGPVTTGLGEIYQYVVRPEKGFEKKYDATELRTIQDWIVRRQLLGVKGVAEVSSFGGKLKQYEIAVHPNKLQSYGLTIADVFSALEKNNQNTGGSYIEKGATSLFIRSEGLIGSIEDLENIAIQSTPSGLPLLLRDVAEIKIGHATRFGALCYNDQGEVAGAVVMMLKGANSSEVIKNVKERIAQIQKTLPQGVIIEPFLDRTKMVNNAIGTVEKNLLEGALIVIFVLVLFLGNFRAGLLVASVIPLAMLFAIILMNFFGVSGNLMSLGALDFGLIVDGAVIIVEAVMHQLTHSKKFTTVSALSQRQMDGEVKNSASKMMNSAVFGQIIILIVYLPIFTLEGIEGKMFQPMAQTVAFALLGAFLLSLTYIPMMSALFLDKKIKHEPNFSDKMMNQLERKYQHWLQKVLGFPKATIAAVLGLFVFAVILLSNLGGEFIPALEEGDFAVDTRVLTGSNLNTTIENTQKAAYILKSRFPEVEKVVTKIGSGEVPTDPMPMEAADMMVIMKDKSQWTSAHSFNEMAAKMGKSLEEVPGITAGFQYPVQMRFNELMTGARQDVVCKIFGEDLDTLAVYAEKLGRIVGSVEGTQNLFVEPVTGIPQVVIAYNRPILAQYHLNIDEVNKIVNTAFAGQSTGLVFEGEKRFDLMVRLDIDQRKDLEDVQNLLIPTPIGTQVPLSQLAEVSIKNGPNQIQREDAKRRIVVGFNVRGRDVQSIVGELQAKAEKQIKWPAGYYVTYGGAFENLNQAKDRLMIAVPISLLLIFLLLFFAFNSVKQGLLIYSAIPLSAIGGIFFLALRGMPFSISAGVGFIALFGVAVLNGIVLISEFNQLKSEGMNDLHRIVLMGTKVRLRPVLMTAFVASLGFLPMAISNGAGAEVQRPLATVVIGGLMIATFLTLFVLPVLYVVSEKGISFSNKKNLAILLVLLGFSFTDVNAQTPISLDKAMEIALKNNASVKSERLKANYQQQLVKASVNIAPLNLNGDYGQINSYYNDNRVGVSQSLSFPTVYHRQKQLSLEEAKSANLNVTLQETELKKDVALTFYNLIAIDEKMKLLRRSDTIFVNFSQKSQLRFEMGETNVLEKTMAQTQRGHIQMQLLELLQEKELVKSKFQWLLNDDADWIPTWKELKMKMLEIPDSATVENHPNLKLLEQQKQTRLIATQLEKSRLLPGITLGYNSMTITGTGADNVIYDRSTRFQSVQFGLGIPLLGGAQNARIKASKIIETISANEYEKEKGQFRLRFQNAWSAYKNSVEKLAYYEKTALPNALIIQKTADKQFNNGAINYLDWVLLVNESIALQNQYIDAVSGHNQNLIELQYLTSKL
ncbi:CusA/CzcA family heavy metal efflux RND transporter [Flavobacterium sp. CYK-4]|uniref:CusA/CzcA family heavy metal efflux RND transporter n=1 Tax=Flavobacterium lotistagni TaxID=2709660 RepID=UPI001408F615|nr:CusA/CzcA family heavy metal efflux RND transporter [Flavobacterium lotistagni]NHM07233.1 CusA/CzcA family heavy metal efflux RND transporter [Flavobacterium lotistagni]